MSFVKIIHGVKVFDITLESFIHSFIYSKCLSPILNDCWANISTLKDLIDFVNFVRIVFLSSQKPCSFNNFTVIIRKCYLNPQ